MRFDIFRLSLHLGSTGSTYFISNQLSGSFTYCSYGETLRMESDNASGQFPKPPTQLHLFLLYVKFSLTIYGHVPLALLCVYNPCS